MKRLVVGVTFFLHREPGGGSVWTNGGIQHCAFLVRLLERCGQVAKVYAINGGDGIEPPALLARYGLEFVKLEAVKDELDLLVEAGAQVSAADVAAVRARGGRAVGFKYGNAYVIDGERIVHGKDPGSIQNGSEFDEIWTNPQHVATCAGYWEVLYRCPVRVLPHVWDSTFVDMARTEFPPSLSYGYSPGRARKRVAVLEPNVNLIKTCVVPLLACEAAYRARPELFASVSVTNAEQIRDHLTFRRLVESLDLGRDRLPDGGTVASFEGRYITPWYLAAHADCVVAHQWENAANYLVYDVLHGGYPLVHNYPSLPEGLGYRYEGFDVIEASRQLVRALTEHDERLPEQRELARSFLSDLRPTGAANVTAHEAAIERLFTARAEGRASAA